MNRHSKQDETHHVNPESWPPCAVDYLRKTDGCDGNHRHVKAIDEGRVGAEQLVSDSSRQIDAQQQEEPDDNTAAHWAADLAENRNGSFTMKVAPCSPPELVACTV